MRLGRLLIASMGVALLGASATAFVDRLGVLRNRVVGNEARRVR